MTKDIRIIITIEIENSRRMIAKYIIPSDNFGQRMREVQKQIDEIVSEAIIESHEDRISFTSTKVI